MKKNTLSLVGALLLGTTVFAQKAEIKSAQKAVADKQWKTAKMDIDKAGVSVAQNRRTLPDGIMASYYYTRGNVYMAIADNHVKLSSNTNRNPVVTAAQAYYKLEAFESSKSFQAKSKTSGHWEYFDSEEAMKNAMSNRGYSRARVRKRSKKYSGELNTKLGPRVSKLSKDASAAYQSKRFQQASDDFAVLYYLDAVLTGKKNMDYLYYAATAAVQAKEYKTAIKYYQQLLDAKYTGVSKRYSMMNKQTGKRQPVLNEKLAKTLEKTGKFTDLRVDKLPNKQPKVYRFAAYSYAQLGNQAKAVELLKKAVSLFPKDQDLVSDLGNIYIKQGNTAAYVKVLKQLMANNPNDPQLLYNMGIALRQQGKHEEAEKYFRRVLALKPDMPTVYLDLAATILWPEQKIISKMNRLGNSKSDNAKYKRLQKVRAGLYKKALPILEKARRHNPKNMAVLQTLKNIYANQNMDAKYKEIKAYIDTLLKKK